MSAKTSHKAPAWLTEEYVEKRLRVYFKNETLNVDIKPAIASGENYASVMTRIYVDYTTSDSKHKQAVTFLVKTTFADKDPVSHILLNYGIYTREMDIYERILPRLADIVKNELRDSRKLFAATVNVDCERDSIVFEDLSLEKYKVACRVKKLDLEHVHLVLEKLANFHAAGAALAERQPGIFEKNYDRGFFNKHVRSYEPIMKNILIALSHTLELNPDLKERYKTKIDRLIDNVMDYGERSTSLSPGDFVTLAHGDIWTTNVMFQYDDQGHPINAILIDFQFSVWNSPAIDLHYFFSTSIHENLRLQHQTELVQFYYYKLAEALKKVKYLGKVPSLFEFQHQFRSKAFYAVFASLIFEPTMVYNGKEELSIQNFMSNDEKCERLRDAVYQTEENQKKLRLSLPFFDQLGLLDDM
ncbi:LOW QUALITY PROTEIN: uncharacterized protein LOC108113795 [Drosophila eugracilis]|uniref:LOW QUALITY PROTEIN: uncharacterized protein LOC108113795 n=1 Tax=Drosophila eugracilis TaxID=29029 RepID=UPI001BDAB824|nr:LOW QUALITY PROTEIN: uncharacterized protein LOC108113795 [Drosophila eugracilis]